MPTTQPYHRRFDRHYCRKCPVDFSAGETYPSPHNLVLIHMVEQHNGRSRPINSPCTRYCAEHEQHDEARLGSRIYGPGAEKKPKLIGTYDELFPEDDHA